MSFDNWLRLLQIVALLGGAKWILSAGLAMRDGLHDLKQATSAIRGTVDDHEDRIRVIEGKPMRRAHDSKQLGV